jgi:hypothetical protein
MGTLDVIQVNPIPTGILLVRRTAQVDLYEVH